MLDNLTNRLAGIVKTLRGQSRFTEENIADALREEIAFVRASMSGRSSMQALSDEASMDAQLDASRFAYQQALRSWPECEEARAGLGALADLRMTRAEASTRSPSEVKPAKVRPR